MNGVKITIMPVIKKTSRFAKELKKPDEFITTTLAIVKFFQKYQKESLIVISLLILAVLIWAGITTYTRYSLSSDMLALKRAIDDLQTITQGKTDTDLSEVDKKLERISEKYPGSTLGVRSALLRAKIQEARNDFLSAARILEESGKNWSSGNELKFMLLLKAADDYARAGEYTRAIEIYDTLLKDPENQKKDKIYIRKADALRKAGKNDELKDFIATSVDKVQDELMRYRLRQLSEGRVSSEN